MLPSPCYIVSDAHLGAAPAEAERALREFIAHLRGRAASLLINGDLFDFWFEWRRVMPRHGYRVLGALADLAESGIPIVWIAGNHDCWGGEILRDAGVRYVVGPWRGDLAGWRALVDHGDGLRKVEDRRYRALRRVLRHPASVVAFRWLHPDLGSRIALGSSYASRAYKAPDDGEGLRSVARSVLAADATLDLVVYGHSHVATLERAPGGGVYANAGGWMDSPTYVRVDEERIELRRWTGSAEGDRLHVLDRRAEKGAP